MACTCATRLAGAARACWPSPSPSPNPNQVLPGLLASGSLGAADLARCAATCSAFARVVTRDSSSDALLWEPARPHVNTQGRDMARVPARPYLLICRGRAELSSPQPGV